MMGKKLTIKVWHSKKKISLSEFISYNISEFSLDIMLANISKYKDQLITNCFKMKSHKFNKTISQFNFYLIIQRNDYQDEIYTKVNKSEVIIIDEFDEQNEKYMIICFDFTLILISLKELFTLTKFFQNCDSSIFIFSNDVEETFMNALNKNNDFSSKYNNKKNGIKCFFAYNR